MLVAVAIGVLGDTSHKLFGAWKFGVMRRATAGAGGDTPETARELCRVTPGVA